MAAGLLESLLLIATGCVGASWTVIFRGSRVNKMLRHEASKIQKPTADHDRKALLLYRFITRIIVVETEASTDLEIDVMLSRIARNVERFYAMPIEKQIEALNDNPYWAKYFGVNLKDELNRFDQELRDYKAKQQRWKPN